MDYEVGKWLERVESKLDFIIEKSGILEEDKKEEKESTTEMLKKLKDEEQSN